MRFLSLSYSILQWIGIFPPCNSSKWTLRALNVYRVAIFVVIGSITILMTTQMIVATDITVLAWTIEIWTMFISGLFKWFSMIMYNNKYAKLRTTLVQIQSQGSTAYGQPANSLTDKYLKLTQKMTILYICSGVFASAIAIISPLMTYPRG